MTREFRRTFFVIVGDVFFYFIIRCACDVCMCVCVYVCMCVYACVCVYYVSVRIHIRVYACMGMVYMVIVGSILYWFYERDHQKSSTKWDQ